MYYANKLDGCEFCNNNIIHFYFDIMLSPSLIRRGFFYKNNSTIYSNLYLLFNWCTINFEGTKIPNHHLFGDFFLGMTIIYI
jgi:hypothetical protein